MVAGLVASSRSNGGLFDFSSEHLFLLVLLCFLCFLRFIFLS